MATIDGGNADNMQKNLTKCERIEFETISLCAIKCLFIGYIFSNNKITSGYLYRMNKNRIHKHVCHDSKNFDMFLTIKLP